MTQINLNDQVRFILTPEGEKIIRANDAAITERLEHVTGTKFDWFQYHEPIDEHGTRTEQLWHLFEIFGQHMQMAAPPYFVNNNIEYLEEDQAWPRIQPSPKSIPPTESSLLDGSAS